MSTAQPSPHPSAFRIAAGFGLAFVALGAFGAHGLEPVLEANGTVAIWEKAVFYHAVHAIALLALAASGHIGPWLTWLWSGGILIFSGSLYILAITGITWLGAITPIGGTALIIGWALLIFGKK